MLRHCCRDIYSLKRGTRRRGRGLVELQCGALIDCKGGQTDDDEWLNECSAGDPVLSERDTPPDEDLNGSPLPPPSTENSVYSDGEGRHRPGTWSKRRLHSAFEAIDREHAVREDPDEFRRRCAELIRKEGELRGIRVKDADYAMDLLLRELVVREDPRKLDYEDRDSESSSLRAEKQRKLAAHKVQSAQIEADIRKQREAAELRMSQLEDKLRREREATTLLEHEIKRSVERAAHRVASRSGSQLGKTHPGAKGGGGATVPESSGATYPQTHSFNDRVILQRMRVQDILKTGTQIKGSNGTRITSRLKKGPAPVRGSSVGTCGGHKMQSSAQAMASAATDMKKQEGDAPSFTPVAESSAYRVRSAQETLKQEERTLPKPKQEYSARDFYIQSGRAPGAPSSSGGSSYSSSGSTSSRSDATYQPESNYSGSTDSDSAFDGLPGNVSEVTPRFEIDSPAHTRSGAVYGTNRLPPEDPGDNSSSSESEDNDHSTHRGSARLPRRRKSGVSARRASSSPTK
ncbi:hypothetical protein GGX14DRAFT_386963 [Mycena pura]|uniref:Uncharacterized protein n=1 Tax=Mycena pura TaxID=153505 RepID=A0AAD6YMS9_9AGAR|nr:hypothetical protein GGX14DRAFT_386963 [Mycena pura]